MQNVGLQSVMKPLMGAMLWFSFLMQRGALDCAQDLQQIISDLRRSQSKFFYEQEAQNTRSACK